MNAWLRPVILAIALAGTTLFGGLLAVSVCSPSGWSNPRGR